MTGDIPTNIEFENQFVHPGNNMPIKDPILLSQCAPLPGIDDSSHCAYLAHFFGLSIAKETNGSSNIRLRSRTIFVGPQRPQPMQQPPQQMPPSNPVSSAENIAAAQAMASQQRANARPAEAPQPSTLQQGFVRPSPQGNFPNAVPILTQQVNAMPQDIFGQFQNPPVSVMSFAQPPHIPQADVVTMSQWEDSTNDGVNSIL